MEDTPSHRSSQSCYNTHNPAVQPELQHVFGRITDNVSSHVSCSEFDILYIMPTNHPLIPYHVTNGLNISQPLKLLSYPTLLKFTLITRVLGAQPDRQKA